MNRRSFIEAALKAAAGFAILPSATAYVRRWKPTPATFYRRENLWVPMPSSEWDATMLSITPAHKALVMFWCNVRTFTAFQVLQAEKDFGLPFPL
jgi:hypothetical protein